MPKENPLIDVDLVRQKVQRLVKAMGISKTKLGEVLGERGGEVDPRVKINRASRFLSGAQKKISLQEVNALARFFEKPVEWFLFDDNHRFPIHLASGEPASSASPKPLEEIRKNLEQMGFDPEFIAAQLTQLKAMEAYNAFRNE